MTLGPSPGVLEDFGAVRSAAPPSGEAPDGAAAPGGAVAGRFGDLVDAWLAPEAHDADTDDSADGATAAAILPFPITLPLPVIAQSPQQAPAATDTAGDACGDDGSAGAAPVDQPPVAPAPQLSPDVTIDPASTPEREKNSSEQLSRREAAAASGRVDRDQATDAPADPGASRNVRDLSALRSQPPADPRASEEPNASGSDRGASAPTPARAVPAPESAAASIRAAAPPSPAAVESESSALAAASEDGVAANAVVDAAIRGESATSAGIMKKFGSRDVDPPHNGPQKPSVPHPSADFPKKSPLGTTTIDPPTTSGAAPKLGRALVAGTSDPNALDLAPASGPAVESSGDQDAPPADAPRRSLNLQLPREPVAPPVIDPAAVPSAAAQIHLRAFALNENGNTREAAKGDEARSANHERVSWNGAAASPEERSSGGTSDDRERDANRDSWRNAAQQTQGPSHASVSQSFVERAESRESSAAALPPSRATAALVHGTAPVVTQATLLQPPVVMSGDAPAVAAPAPDTADRIVQSLKLQVQRGGGDAVLHLEPEHLGPVAITIRVENGVVSAVITAEHPGVAEWLQSNQQSLREGLQSSGLHLERFVVQRDGQSPSDRQRREWAGNQRAFRRRLPQTDSTFEISV